jgi:hypothetical protein
LHERLAAHKSNDPNAIESDGEESEDAASISEGQKTPLPPVEAEDEPGSGSPKQALFYTPEGSPIDPSFSERANGKDRETDEVEHKILPDSEIPSPTISPPPVPTAVTA